MLSNDRGNKMNEEEAKTKRCGGSNGCGTLINPAISEYMPKELKLQLAKEVNSPRWCIASECAVWVVGASGHAIEQAKAAGCGVPVGGRCGLIK